MTAGEMELASPHQTWPSFADADLPSIRDYLVTDTTKTPTESAESIAGRLYSDLPQCIGDLISLLWCRCTSEAFLTEGVHEKALATADVEAVRHSLAMAPYEDLFLWLNTLPAHPLPIVQIILGVIHDRIESHGGVEPRSEYAGHHKEEGDSFRDWYPTAHPFVGLSHVDVIRLSTTLRRSPKFFGLGKIPDILSSSLINMLATKEKNTEELSSELRRQALVELAYTVLGGGVSEGLLYSAATTFASAATDLRTDGTLRSLVFAAGEAEPGLRNCASFERLVIGVEEYLLRFYALSPMPPTSSSSGSDVDEQSCRCRTDLCNLTTSHGSKTRSQPSRKAKNMSAARSAALANLISWRTERICRHVLNACSLTQVFRDNKLTPKRRLCFAEALDDFVLVSPRDLYQHIHMLPVRRRRPPYQLLRLLRRLQRWRRNENVDCQDLYNRVVHVLHWEQACDKFMPLGRKYSLVESFPNVAVYSLFSVTCGALPPVPLSAGVRRIAVHNQSLVSPYLVQLARSLPHHFRRCPEADDVDSLQTVLDWLAFMVEFQGAPSDDESNVTILLCLNQLLQHAARLLDAIDVGVPPPRLIVQLASAAHHHCVRDEDEHEVLRVVTRHLTSLAVDTTSLSLSDGTKLALYLAELRTKAVAHGMDQQLDLSCCDEAASTSSIASTSIPPPATRTQNCVDCGQDAAMTPDTSENMCNALYAWLSAAMREEHYGDDSDLDRIHQLLAIVWSFEVCSTHAQVPEWCAAALACIYPRHLTKNLLRIPECFMLGQVLGCIPGRTGLPVSQALPDTSGILQDLVSECWQEFLHLHKSGSLEPYGLSDDNDACLIRLKADGRIAGGLFNVLLVPEELWNVARARPHAVLQRAALQLSPTGAPPFVMCRASTCGPREVVQLLSQVL